MSGHSWEASMPARIRALPRDHRNLPVPFFITQKDDQGRWDFRIASQRVFYRCLREGRCWVCGQTMGRFKAFPIGPMCVVNRVTSEPPAHRECAEFSAKACPFLTKPRMRRNEGDMPADLVEPAGIMLKRNPGVVAMYITREFRTFQPQAGGIMIQIGSPEEVVWFREGRLATREEVNEAIASGMPTLIEIARMQGTEAVQALQQMFNAALPLLPPMEAPSCAAP